MSRYCRLNIFSCTILNNNCSYSVNSGSLNSGSLNSDSLNSGSLNSSNYNSHSFNSSVKEDAGGGVLHSTKVIKQEDALNEDGSQST